MTLLFADEYKYSVFFNLAMKKFWKKLLPKSLVLLRCIIPYHSFLKIS